MHYQKFLTHIIYRVEERKKKTKKEKKRPKLPETFYSIDTGLSKICQRLREWELIFNVIIGIVFSGNSKI